MKNRPLLVIGVQPENLRFICIWPFRIKMATFHRVHRSEVIFIATKLQSQRQGFVTALLVTCTGTSTGGDINPGPGAGKEITTIIWISSNGTPVGT